MPKEEEFRSLFQSDFIKISVIVSIVGTKDKEIAISTDINSYIVLIFHISK